MGMLILPKQFHPDFAIKNRKPVGPVEVDWSNPITRGLEAAYIFDNEKSLRDYAKSIHNGTVTGTPNFIGSIQGRALNFSGSSESFDVPDHPGLNFLDGQNFTFVTGVVSNSVAQSAEVYEKQLSTPINQLFTQGSVWRFYVRTNSGSQFLISSRAPIAGEYINAACVRVSSGTNHLYINGVSVVSGTDPGGDVNADTTLKIGRGNAGNWNGELFYMWVFRRALNSAEVQSLHFDPYQILKPATPISYFMPVADGAESITADAGSYAYSGTAAGLLLSALLSGDTEAYNYTGTAVDLNLGRTMAADTAQYTYNGTVTDLIFTGVGNFTLTADTDLYIYTGTEAGIFFGANLAANTDQYDYTGTAATLTHNLNLLADTAQYTYTGTAAALQSGRIMISESGSYIITGTAVVLDFSGNIWTDEPNAITNWTTEADKITTWTEQASASTVWTVI